MRIDRIDLVSHSDTTTCTLGQVWMYLAPGSGIWYNLGRSKRVMTTGQSSMLWWSLPTRPCSIAKDEGCAGWMPPLLAGLPPSRLPPSRLSPSRLPPSRLAHSPSTRLCRFDSIQILEFENGFSYELLDCRGADLPDFDKSWDVGCTPPHIELRSGLPPRQSRWAPALEELPVEAEGTVECVCDQSMWHINCEGAGR